jgi:hypothetical protein
MKYMEDKYKCGKKAIVVVKTNIIVLNFSLTIPIN